MTQILYICPSSGIGGAETFIRQSFRLQNKALFNNHYLLFRTGPLYDYLKKEGAHVELLSSPPRLSSLKDHQFLRVELKRIINQKNIKLVHSTMAYSALFAAWTCHKMNIPHVWFQHGPASGWMDRLAALLPHQGLIVNSHFTSSEQRRLENPLRFFVPRKLPIEKILLGTDIIKPSQDKVEIFRNKIMTQLHLKNKDTVFIAMLCRLQEWKGVHILLDAIRKLQDEKITRPFYVLIWGDSFKNENYKNDLQDTIKKYQLNATLMGPTDDPPLTLSTIDIIVNASIQPEPFGYSIIEGMKMGAIPVVPNEGGPCEIVSHGVDGLQFQAGESASLAREIKILLEDPHLREKLAIQSQKTVEIKFQAQRAMIQLEKFHTRVLENQKATI